MGVSYFSIEDLTLDKKGQKKKSAFVTSSRLSIHTIDEIRREAKNRGIRTQPLDIERVIKEIFNINVIKDEMDRNISGYIEENANKTSWNIYINQYDNLRRQNFTMAHELAHFVLEHSSSLINGRKDESILLRSDNDDEVEKEANDFAAELLMPENEFRECIEKGINTFEQLALYFDVSISAIKYRAYKLKYIGSY